MILSTTISRAQIFALLGRKIDDVIIWERFDKEPLIYIVSHRALEVIQNSDIKLALSCDDFANDECFLGVFTSRTETETLIQEFEKVLGVERVEHPKYLHS
ncbi:hypothetical protein C0584_04070 [Candidatus Parcubacteria bacterium]|nr:MAG: hypothetical protein C0584_04070 [Candidatus Parcubacteria bacterium]